jgi:branched-subunit amino acid transport protein
VNAEVWAIVVGMGIANYLIRLAPFAALSRVEIPGVVRRWLSYVPVSVLAAIVANEILIPQGEWIAPWDNPYLLAALPTAATYWWTKSFIVTTLLGIVYFLVARALLG